MARLNRISSGRISLGTLVAVVMALLAGAVACSKSGTKTALPPVDLKGPIVAVMMASSIDDKGQPVNPRFTFPPDERQLTMIVQVGKITGSPLDITWYKTSDDGDQKLFQHTIEVKTYDRAFSIGKNPGRLAPGSYKAAVTLEGYKREIEFDVAVAKGKSPLATRSEPVQGAPPISGGSGTAPRPSAPEGAPKDRNPRQQNRPKECDVSIMLFSSEFEPDNTDLDSPIVVIGAGGCNVSPSGFDFGTVEAKIDGRPMVVPRFDGPEYHVDPCSLDRGSDLPGIKVKFRAVAGNDPSNTAQMTTTLGEDTLAPRVNTVSSIKRGTKVKAGDKIKLNVTATEKRSGGPWQTGVKMIQVTAEPGGLVKDPWTNPSNLPKACNEKTWEHKDEATYTVPSNPPPIIKICAIAEDYVGNESSQCGEFYTGPRWTGTMISLSKQTGTKGLICSGDWWTTFSFVVNDKGVIAGQATAKMTGVVLGACPHAATASGFPQAMEYTYSITGTATPQQLKLQLTASAVTPAGGVDFTGFAAPILNTGGAPAVLTVPITSAIEARGGILLRYQTGPNLYTSDNVISLVCKGC